MPLRITYPGRYPARRKRYVARRRRYPARRKRYAGKRAVRGPSRWFRQVVPQRMFTKMHYVEMLAHQTITAPGGNWSYIFQSSLYDPNLTGTGHQPMWYDQYQALYLRNRVHGFRYKIVVVNEVNSPLNFAISHRNSNETGGNNVLAEMERLNCRKKAYVAAALGPGSFRYFSGYLNVPFIEGISKQDFRARTEYECLWGANPSKTAKIELQAGDVGNNCTFSVRVELIFYVEMSERKIISQS